MLKSKTKHVIKYVIIYDNCNTGLVNEVHKQFDTEEEAISYANSNIIKTEYNRIDLYVTTGKPTTDCYRSDIVHHKNIYTGSEW